jgi:hypothetical protein
MAQTYNDAVPAITRNALEDLTAIRNNFAALKSCFSGATAPPDPVAGMWWYDTTANMLKIRNEANNAWLNVYDFANGRAPLALNCVRTVVAGAGLAVSGSLSSGNVTVSIATGGVTNTLVGNGQLGSEKFQTGTEERDWVLARCAAGAVGAVGTYAFMKKTDTGSYNPGATIAGSKLQYAGVGEEVSGTGFAILTSTSPSGTWRCMGYAPLNMSYYVATLWLRIA